MPKIGHLVTKLQVGDKYYQNPEVWNTAHKMRKVAKKEEYLKNIKANSLLNSSYRVFDSSEIDYSRRASEHLSSLDSPRYTEFAPWSTVFNTAKQIILFKK